MTICTKYFPGKENATVLGKNGQYSVTNEKD